MDSPLNNDIEVLKAGNFPVRVKWFNSEFSQDIENAVKTGQELMYFWAIARNYFKAWLFKKNGRGAVCAELVKKARAMIAVIWGDGEVSDHVLTDAKEMANDMVMCYERFTGSEDDRLFVETFSTDDNPKDFRMSICRTLKEFETEKDAPDPGVSAKYVIHQA